MGVKGLNDIALRVHTSELRDVTCHMRPHRPATRHRWTCPALTPARKAGTRFTYPGGMEGWVDPGDWLYREGLPACRLSPIQVLTGPDVEQLHWLRPTCYH